MINVYELCNPKLIRAFKNKDIENLKEITSKSIFLIPVKNKSNINKISFEAIMDSSKNLYLPIFINMTDVEMNNMIKGKQILIAHFGMIETILKNNTNLNGIVINAGTMDYKINKKDSLDICYLYHKNKDKLTFKPDFYQSEKFSMADLKPKNPIPRAEILVKVVEYMKKTNIKKVYLKVKNIGDKLCYNFYIDYNKSDQSFIDELTYIIQKLLNEKEDFVILNAKKGINSKIIRYLKPIYEKNRK